MFITRSFASLLAIVTLAQAAAVYRPLSTAEQARLNARAALSSDDVLEARDGSRPRFEPGNLSHNYPNVRATGTNGPTNPDHPSKHTDVNQNSNSRLISINSVDDWCTFAPKNDKKEIGDVEESVVAYCTKPRNNARVIPDGTVSAAHFVKTPAYVQIMALGDFTRINVKKRDEGGELDPHGQFGDGNPIGGNVTSNISGKEVFYQEWMNYVSDSEVCFRVCTAGSSEADPRKICNHVYDLMGCRWVMPGSYKDNSFDSCEADVAYPPGVYVKDGKSSTFQQYYVGTWLSKGPDGTRTMSFTNGDKHQKTPEEAYSRPKSSKCSSTHTISNGLHL